MAPTDNAVPDTAGPVGTLSEDSVPDTADAALIGTRIRARRRELGLTLQTVGERIGVSKSHLGQVETAKITVSLNLLEKISSVLGLPIKNLIAAPGSADPAEPAVQRPAPDRRVFLTRADRRKAVVLPGGRSPLEVLTPDLQRLLEVTQSADPPGDWHEVDHSVVAPEEFVHVVEGSYEIEEGDVRHTLHPGDSMVFYPTGTYRVRNPGTVTARALWVTLPAAT